MIGDSPAIFAGVGDSTHASFHANCAANNADYCVFQSNTLNSNTNLLQFSASASVGTVASWTLSGPDAGSFALSGSSSNRRNVRVGGSNLAANRVYEFTLTVTDDDGYSTSRSFRVGTAP